MENWELCWAYPLKSWRPRRSVSFPDTAARSMRSFCQPSDRTDTDPVTSQVSPWEALQPAACVDCCKSVNVKGRAAKRGNVPLSWTGRRSLHTPELLPVFSVLGSSNHWSTSKKSGLPWVRKLSHNGVHNGAVLLWPFSLVP